MARQKTGIEKKCLQCNQLIWVSPSRTKKKFCSRTCQSYYLVTHGIIGMRGKKHSEEARNKISKSHMGIIAGILAVPKRETSLETKLYQELDQRGIQYKKQYSLDGKFLVDAYIPKLRTVIETDGEYWHSLPRVIARDAKKTEYCEENNYILIRLSEDEINNNLFRERLVF